MIMSSPRIFLIGDTHFGDTNILKFSRYPGYEKDIIKNWKNLVTNNDIIIHLGDVFYPEYYDIMFKLPARSKILVRGNHDKKSFSWYLNHGFNMCVDNFYLHYMGLDLLFTHIPQLDIPKNYVNVHAHLHDRGYDSKEYNRHALVSIENTMSPILLKTLLRRFL